MSSLPVFSAAILHRTLTLLAPTDIGANASAEEAGEDLDDTKVKVNNIVASFRLQSTQFDKKSFLSYLKGTIALLPSTSCVFLFNEARA